eukprot:CAMPEP_0198574856 /NCGR_PEP_ID=MMETSP1462-20131121/115326_1 /TAXON_ID=1333877 /ORGANISM="Brandtodinium nutriculum, Strain RCC3387" /LENGTH=348 /DNA_ID=CAMNT_0044306085 /DNA_START=5 /DNA_END=1047 /DNA_ORIENTATION=-
MTDTSRTRGRLKAMLDDRLPTASGTAARYVLATAVTYVLPLIAIFIKTPQCDIEAMISEETDLETTMGEFLGACTVGKYPAALVAAFAVVAGPAYNVAVCLFLSATLLCTPRVYSAYVRLVLAVFVHLRDVVAPVLYTGVKAQPHALGSPFRIWRRLSFLPYTIMGWFLGVNFAILSTNRKHLFSTAYILGSFLYYTYIPALVAIFAPADSAFAVIVNCELQRRSLQQHESLSPSGSPAVGLKKARTVTDASSASTAAIQSHMTATDVWWRLFNHSGSVFALSSLELAAVCEYFELSQRGLDGNRWPVWWHDDLYITGNTGLTAIYIEDMDVLLTADMPAGAPPREEA